MFLKNKLLGLQPVDEREDMVENVRRLLQTKRGCGSFLRDYGLSDVSHLSGEEVAAVLPEEIKRLIEKYEPRLRVREVEEAYNDQTHALRLIVHCQASDSDEEFDFGWQPWREDVAEELPPVDRDDDDD